MERQDPPGAEPSPPEPPLRWHPLPRAILFVAVFVLVQIVVGVPALFIWAVVTDTNPMLMAQGVAAGGFILFVNVCAAPVLGALTVLFLRRLDQKEVAAIGFRWPEGGRPAVRRQVVLSLAAVPALLGLWLAAVAAFGEVELAGASAGVREGPGAPLAGWLGPGAGAAAVTAFHLLGFLVQGGVEEWVFRGYAFHALRERWSWASAAGATSLFFAVLHGLNPSVGPAGLLNTFLLGLLLAAAVELTGSLLAVTVLHGWWNFLLAVVLSVPVSGAEFFHLLDLELGGPDRLTGGAFGPEGSWALTVLLVPLVLLAGHRIDGGTAEGTGDPGPSA
ncbi:MAG: CPBP family intramembrane glutamic endopeptidase [Thermoanaerobaculia bacterium]